MIKMLGKRMWIERSTYRLGGSKRKTKRREQRRVREEIMEDVTSLAANRREIDQ